MVADLKLDEAGLCKMLGGEGIFIDSECYMYPSQGIFSINLENAF